MRLAEPLRDSGLVVICDSGFCILKAFATCKEVGRFESALIKKCHYWSKHVKGVEIMEHLSDKEIGYVDTIQCKLDGQDLYIMGCKEPDYVLMIITSFGTLNQISSMNTRQVNNEQEIPKIINFKYPEIALMHI